MPGIPAPPREQALFGGAMVCALPAGCQWQDASDLRPVPDHQEVFVGRSGEAVVVEIVEHTPGVSDEDAAGFYFNDQAEQNAAAAATIAAVHPCTPEDTPGFSGRASYASIASGTQEVPKGPAGALQVVHVALAVVRLPAVGSDVLVVLNMPAGPEAPGPGVPHGAGGGQDGVATLRGLLGSLQVRDWGLFGSEIEQ